MTNINNQVAFRNSQQVTFGNNKQASLSDEDDFRSFQPGCNEPYLSFFESTHTSRCITAYLDERIEGAKYYRNLLQSIYNLSQGDRLELVINSYGGALDGALAIISAMQNTDADTVVMIDGAAASAASLIALAAPTLMVSEYSTMMIHSATFGSVGKQSDVISHATFMDKRIKSIMQDIYKDFLSEEELQDVMTGREIWLDAEGIIQRLEQRQIRQKERQEKEQEQQQAIQQKTPRKSPAKQSTTSGKTAGKPASKPAKKPAGKAAG